MPQPARIAIGHPRPMRLKAAGVRGGNESTRDPRQLILFSNGCEPGPTVNTDADIPPIVLFVSRREETTEPYYAALQNAGFWLARSGSLPDALQNIRDLHPDIVIADLRSEQLHREGREFVRELKANFEKKTVPLVVLEEAIDGERPPLELDASDVRLRKPMSTQTFLNGVAQVLAASRERRSRAVAAADRVAAPRSDSAVVPEARQAPKRVARSTMRTCPACGDRLTWVDRGTIDGVEYDYYDWCASGCGLYCFDIEMGNAVKLV